MDKQHIDSNTLMAYSHNVNSNSIYSYIDNRPNECISNMAI